MEGLLYKWTNDSSGWQPRWFVLDQGVLAYYKSQDEVNQESEGSIKLSACKILVHPTDTMRVDIVIPYEQHFYLKAPSPHKRHVWLVALGSAEAGIPPAIPQTKIEKEQERNTVKAKRSEQQVYSVNIAADIPDGAVLEHIVRRETVSSEQIRGSEGGTETVSDVDDDVRSTGSHSQASTSTRKDKGKGKGSSRTLDTTHSNTCVSEKDFSNILKNLMSKADSIAPTFMGQHKIVHDFACLLESYMRAIPVHRWHEFQIECLNLAHRYRDESQVFQQAQQQPLVTWAGPQQQPWQPPQQQQPW
ncbi:pleckstrin homology domain-containing family A member 8-like isoform X2 [Palaemon carinicauda]|uniref:pleckstrin homology domain-containing family A member 8-like isoform X2 n=1 Tax=Palaemon carinicauda TaxID=392227 RepID=UPI0035B572C6